MAIPSGTGKHCVICGEDCSNKPRTKDAKGRYYCRDCHSAAVRKKSQSAKPVAKAPPKNSAVDLDDEPPSFLEQLIDAAPPSAGHAQTCSNCHNPVAPDTVLCMNCGFNLQTGQRIGTEVKKAKRERSGAGIAALGPYASLLAGVASAAIYAVLILIAIQMPDKAAGAGVVAVWHLPFSIGVSIFVLILAFRESIGTGLLTLCIPCYVLYFIYGVCDNPWARILFPVNVIASIVWTFLFYESPTQF